MSSSSNSNSIERSIVIQAPRQRVWQALSNAEAFGAWFGADLRGQVFAPGQRTRGRSTACGHEDHWFDVVVERIEPEHLFSYRWHPYAADAELDLSHEAPTLVSFSLQDAPDASTLLTVVESGFDTLSPQRRLEAFPSHSRGWDEQLANIQRHVCG